MKRFLFAFLLVGLMAGVGQTVRAQDSGEAHAALGVFAGVNSNAQRFNNIGVSGDAGYKYKGFDFSASARSGDRNITRTTYTVTYDAYKYEGVQFSVGGGFFRDGNGRKGRQGGFGSIGAKYEKWDASLQAGVQEFVNFELRRTIWGSGSFSLAPTFRYEHRDDGRINFNRYSVGLRLEVRGE